MKPFKKITKKSGKAKLFSPAFAEKDKRLVRLVRLMLLLDRGVLNLDHAARECGVSKRTIQRDLNVLEAAGIPLYKPCEANSNYCLAKDFRLFHYRLTPQNAEDFVNAYTALLAFAQKPYELVPPIQKEYLRFAEQENSKEEKRRAETGIRLCAVKAGRSDFLSLMLQGSLSAEPVCEKLQKIFLLDLLVTRDYPYAYQQAQLEENARVLAHMYRLERRYEKALQLLQKIRQRDPHEAWSYGEMAFVYYEQHQVSEALQVVEEGIQKANDKEALGLYRVFLLAEDKQYERALSAFQRLCPYEDAFFAFAAQLHFKAGQLPQALKYINRALERVPDHKGYQLYKGAILQALHAVKPPHTDPK